MDFNSRKLTQKLLNKIPQCCASPPHTQTHPVLGVVHPIVSSYFLIGVIILSTTHQLIVPKWKINWIKLDTSHVWDSWPHQRNCWKHNLRFIMAL